MYNLINATYVQNYLTTPRVFSPVKYNIEGMHREYRDVIVWCYLIVCV